MTQNKHPIVLLKTTFGDIKIELWEDKAPTTVSNFLKYVDAEHYSHTIFHRVIDGFMIQGGGMTKDLKQKATLPPIENEAHNGLANKRGTIAMARTGEVNSATAQFFINVVDNAFLNFRSKNPREYGYCVFGQVVEGLEVVDKIKSTATESKGHYQDIPVTPIEILHVKRL